MRRQSREPSRRRWWRRWQRRRRRRRLRRRRSSRSSTRRANRTKRISIDCAPRVESPEEKYSERVRNEVGTTQQRGEEQGRDRNRAVEATERKAVRGGAPRELPEAGLRRPQLRRAPNHRGNDTGNPSHTIRFSGNFHKIFFTPPRTPTTRISLLYPTALSSPVMFAPDRARISCVRGRLAESYFFDTPILEKSAFPCVTNLCTNLHKHLPTVIHVSPPFLALDALYFIATPCTALSYPRQSRPPDPSSKGAWLRAGWRAVRRFESIASRWLCDPIKSLLWFQSFATCEHEQSNA